MKNPTFNPVLYRTYARFKERNRENFDEVRERAIRGLKPWLDAQETEQFTKFFKELKVFPSGRWLWVGGTPWIQKRENYPGAYNCTSTEIESFSDIAYLMDLTMQGCGTGAILEDNISSLPEIRSKLLVSVSAPVGVKEKEERKEQTELKEVSALGVTKYKIEVGDSRQGWCLAYQHLMELSTVSTESNTIEVDIDLSSVRPFGERLKGFGGVSNPVKLEQFYLRIADILNGAVGRKLNSLEVCLLIDEAAVVVVAGNVRRSAGMRQGSQDDELFKSAKLNLWTQTSDGKWVIDPLRDALRMANHTIVYHKKPTLEDCISSLRQQYTSGEGAIEWAGEAIARANRDLGRETILAEIEKGTLREFLESLGLSEYEVSHRLGRYGLNPCGEIIGKNFFCNLSEVHLNRLIGAPLSEIEDAFSSAGKIAAALLHHNLPKEKFRKSREIDPIVGVSPTGLFDYFVYQFGVPWLVWWQQGRPDTDRGRKFKEMEREFLTSWRIVTEQAVWEYCDRHGLKRPNRCTTVQPSGSKSLLTGASPGWHPPKALRYIRRITFRREDPVALACMDAGYNVIPSQADKDDKGQLLDDPLDPRCSEWLVEVPVEVPWANYPGVAEAGIDPSHFSATAQFDFYMQVQKYWTKHNTSGTIEFRKHEIEPLATAIYNAIRGDEGYISVALLARFDDFQTFPRLPFEPIDKCTYDELIAQIDRKCPQNFDFYEAVIRHETPNSEEFLHGPDQCDSGKCLLS